MFRRARLRLFYITSLDTFIDYAGYELINVLLRCH